MKAERKPNEYNALTSADLAPLTADDYATAMECINFRLTHGPAMPKESADRLKRARRAFYFRHIRAFGRELRVPA